MRVFNVRVIFSTTITCLTGNSHAAALRAQSGKPNPASSCSKNLPVTLDRICRIILNPVHPVILSEKRQKVSSEPRRGQNALRKKTMRTSYGAPFWVAFHEQRILSHTEAKRHGDPARSRRLAVRFPFHPFGEGSIYSFPNRRSFPAFKSHSFRTFLACSALSAPLRETFNRGF